MKKGLVLGIIGLGISLLAVGCSTYSGGMGEDYNTTYGSAADMRSPGGLDRAKGTNSFYTVPPTMQDDINTVPEADIDSLPQ